MNYRKYLLWLIAISTLVRIFIASSMELGNSEVYYWVYSLKLQWNYFDHPPMVAWLIRLTTLNNWFHTELAVRFGSMISSAICTLLIFRIGAAIYNLQTGWYAALLYTSCYYSSVAAGAFILPDSPQMVFWLASILLLIKILHTPLSDNRNHKEWILFGISTGLCIMSKAHGVFLWLGVLCFALLYNRSWIKNPWIYISALITGIIVSPILIWNVQEHFASYAFHSERIAVSGFDVDFPRFLKQLASVILICNPVNYFLICQSFRYLFKKEFCAQRQDVRLILCCSLPLIVALLFVSLFREIYPHWPGPAYSSLLILPAITLSNRYKEIGHFPNVLKWALAFLVIVISVQIFITSYFPGTISPEKQGLYVGKADPTLDNYGWKEAGRRFDSLYKKDIADGMMSPNTPLIITNWYPAGHLDFYVADKTGQQTIGIGDILQIHQYYWLNQYKKPLKNGDDAYYIMPSNLFDYKAFDRVTRCFQSYTMPLTMDEYRAGSICREIYVFRMKGFQKK